MSARADRDSQSESTRERRYTKQDEREERRYSYNKQEVMRGIARKRAKQEVRQRARQAPAGRARARQAPAGRACEHERTRPSRSHLVFTVARRGTRASSSSGTLSLACLLREKTEIVRVRARERGATQSKMRGIARTRAASVSRESM